MFPDEFFGFPRDHRRYLAGLLAYEAVHRDIEIFDLRQTIEFP